MIKVWDGLMTDDFLMGCYHHYSMNMNWRLDNVANRSQYPRDSFLNKGSHLFLSASPNTDSQYVELPYRAWHETYAEFETECHKIDCNLQSYKIDGTWHRDTYDNEEEYTLLFFPHYKWNDDWGGNFQYKENGQIVDVPIRPGRMILTDTTIEHRGLGPDKPYIYRMSVAYRLRRKYD